MPSGSDRPWARTGLPSGSPQQSPQGLVTGQVLLPSQAESYGPILSVGTQDPADVDAEVVLELLRAAYRRGDAIGLDTEYVTDDLQRSNCHRAIVHLVSLGIPEPTHITQSATGLPVATRVVISGRALQHFRKWFASDHKKVLYNAPADLHALETTGITVANWEDLLGLSRYLAPDHKDHSLKWHIQHSLGYRGEGEYKEHFYTFKIGKKGLPTKQRVPIRLAEIVPGHPLWEKLKVYAALDAKATVELYYKWVQKYPCLSGAGKEINEQRKT